MAPCMQGRFAGERPKGQILSVVGQRAANNVPTCGQLRYYAVVITKRTVRKTCQRLNENHKMNIRTKCCANGEGYPTRGHQIPYLFCGIVARSRCFFEHDLAVTSYQKNAVRKSTNTHDVRHDVPDEGSHGRLTRVLCESWDRFANRAVMWYNPKTDGCMVM